MFGFVTVLKFRGEVGQRWGYRVKASLGGGGDGGGVGGEQEDLPGPGSL